MNDYQRFQQIIEFLEKLPKKFWGTIEIKFRNGKPILILEHKQTKID